MFAALSLRVRRLVTCWCLDSNWRMREKPGKLGLTRGALRGQNSRGEQIAYPNRSSSSYLDCYCSWDRQELVLLELHR